MNFAGFLFTNAFLLLIGLLSTDGAAATPKPHSTTTRSIEAVCNGSESCKDCVSNVKCLWCSSKQPSCIPYPTGHVLPPSSVCPLSDARWGECLVNFEALLICVGVLAGVLVIGVVVTVCCCCRCRRKRRLNRLRREDAVSNVEFEERRAQNAERRAERQARYDDIRRKYGLSSNDSTPYRRFENEA